MKVTPSTARKKVIEATVYPRGFIIISDFASCVGDSVADSAASVFQKA